MSIDTKTTQKIITALDPKYILDADQYGKQDVIDKSFYTRNTENDLRVKALKQGKSTLQRMKKTAKNSFTKAAKKVRNAFTRKK